MSRHPDNPYWCRGGGLLPPHAARRGTHPARAPRGAPTRRPRRVELPTQSRRQVLRAGRTDRGPETRGARVTDRGRRVCEVTTPPDLGVADYAICWQKVGSLSGGEGSSSRVPDLRLSDWLMKSGLSRNPGRPRPDEVTRPAPTAVLPVWPRPSPRLPSRKRGRVTEAVTSRNPRLRIYGRSSRPALRAFPGLMG